ncbi:MAG: hypothetical protein ACRDP3_27950 [Streptomyces sp.]|uniref:hypothetical protein n=1 Tax=Streptomyces sp. TaxID=1931 RepID=UPI003D6A3A9E
MQLSRPPHGPRPRAVAAAVCFALLAASVSACGATEKLTTGLKVRNAVEKLGERPSASVTASVDGSARQAYAFLERTRGDAATHKDAVRLARAELTVAAGSGSEETPLKDMRGSDATNVAAALNFGGRDFAAVKSVRDKLYLRVSLRSLVRQTGGSQGARRTAAEIVALADDLPVSLGGARDALQGKWVRADPEQFDEFATAAQTLAERRAKRADDGNGGSDGQQSDRQREEAERSREFRDAVTVGSALDGQSQRAFVKGVQKLLREHATFTGEGEHGGADRVRMTLPGRESAKDLVGALKALGADIDPKRVPDGDITAGLAIRNGQLTSLTLDLGQFTGDGTRLPLRLDFGAGEAVPVTAPGGAKEIEPQDLLAAFMYGALGTENL